MSHPDPLIMSADIARMATERPELGEELTRALYQHLVLIEGRQPTIDELRDYVERLSSLDERVLRERLGLAGRRRRGLRALAKPRQDGSASPVKDEIRLTRPGREGTARGPGRPGWTDGLFWSRYQQAMDRAAPPFTYRSIAPHFEALDGTRGTDPEYIRKLVRRHGLPPDQLNEPGASSPP